MNRPVRMWPVICLDHFNLLDKKQVGQTTNMLDIVTAMQLADKVINV